MSAHGTHVSGSAVGSGALSGGKYKGAAPGAGLYFYKIGNDVNAHSTDADEIKAINRSLAVGCRVFTMSFGGLDHYPDGSDPVSQAVDAAVTAGMVVFSSAGNEANDDQHDSVDLGPGQSAAVTVRVENTGADSWCQVLRKPSDGAAMRGLRRRRRYWWRRAGGWCRRLVPGTSEIAPGRMRPR